MVSETKVQELLLIAGRGAYPLELAHSARQQGVNRLVAVAFKRETESAIERLSDEVHWIHLGQYGAFLEAVRQSGIRHAVMAGQITPTHLFSMRPDKALLSLLSRLTVRNAETIFGAIAGDLKAMGIDLMPACLFMEAAMPAPGCLTRRTPTASEQNDIDLGLRVAKTTSGIEIGQTVVIKQGTILAVEAFEGTDETVLRAGRLGGPGAVVVKVAKLGHDMRFDIPVVGLRTLKVPRKIEAAALAVEAGRTILLERAPLLTEADRMNLCLVAVKTGGE